MSERLKEHRALDVESGERTAPSHTGDFADRIATPINRAIAKLLPVGFSSRDVVALFDNRTTYGTIRQWRHGRRNVPPWAIELLQTKAAQSVESVSQLKPGPGQHPPVRNIAGWLANR